MKAQAFQSVRLGSYNPRFSPDFQQREKITSGKIQKNERKIPNGGQSKRRKATKIRAQSTFKPSHKLPIRQPKDLCDRQMACGTLGREHPSHQENNQGAQEKRTDFL